MSVFRLLSIVFFSLVAMTRADGPVEAPLDRLSHVSYFAFGGVGVAGTPSEGEKDFVAVLGGPTPLANFQHLLEVGNAQAKCYAMAAFCRLDRPAFKRYLSLLDSDPTPVETMSGCVAAEETFGDVMKRIAAGKYATVVATKEAAK